jgi:hypothetical protein
MLQTEKNKFQRTGKSQFLSFLEGDGDFRSDECIELLKQSDIVITNPPLSLFREYVTQLIEYQKKFLIIGHQNAITYKEIFPEIKDGKLWLGHNNFDNSRFIMSDDYDTTQSKYAYLENGVKYGRVSGLRWYTNLFVDKSLDPIVPYLTFEKGRSMGLYPKYDNYDAINVDKVAQIPMDYYGVMGVPITFLDKWVPQSNFKIIKFRKGDDGKDLTYTSLNDSLSLRIQPYFRILIRDRRNLV